MVPLPFTTPTRLHAACGARGVPASIHIRFETGPLPTAVPVRYACELLEVLPDQPEASEAGASEAEADTNGEPPSLADLVRGELATLEQVQSANEQVFRGFENAKEVSP